MKKFLLIFMAAGLLVACSDDDEPQNEATTTTPDLVQISPVISKATETSFEDGDMIGLNIVCGSETYAENAALSYSGSVFSGSLTWYSLTEDDVTASLTAYYPYTSSGVPTTFTVKSDQSSDSNYTASDLMASTKSGVTPTSSAVTMVFTHQLSKILVSVDNQGDSSISSVVLQGAIPTATVDIENQTVAVDESASAVDITAQAVEADVTYRAIVVPQSVAFTLVLTTADGKTHTANMTSADLVSGGQYTINAVLNSTTLTVTISGEIQSWTDEGVIGEAPDLEEFLDENYIIYHGETYKTVTLSNGTTWMAENMRYVPEGYTVSSDPTSGYIWYPYSMDYAKALEDNGGSISSANIGATYLNVLTDEESIAEKGYLYSFSAANGGVALSEDNYLDVENAQGICPDGWHIPNRAEYFDLVGYTTKSKSESAAQTYSDALLWDATLSTPCATVTNGLEYGLFTFSGSKLASAYSYNVVFSGNSTVEDYYGNQSVTYYWTSTGYSSTQVFGLMTTFSNTYPQGRLSLAYATATFGAPLRCVRDHDIDFYAKHTGLVSPSAAE